MTLHRSQSTCNPSQNSADMPRTRPSLSAVSGVTPLLFLIISFNLGNDTPSFSAKSTWLMAKGLRNSSSNISPGCVGGRFFGSRPLVAILPTFGCLEDRTRALVVVCDFDIVCITVLPAETYPILLIYPNTQLSLSIPFQPLKSIARRNS